jgi:hypothetical protein
MILSSNKLRGKNKALCSTQRHVFGGILTKRVVVQTATPRVAQPTVNINDLDDCDAVFYLPLRH